MFIPAWLIVVAVTVGAYYYIQSKKSSASVGEKPLTIDEMWQQAERNMSYVLEKSPILENFLQDERDMVKAMERDAMSLRERFKFDESKQTEIARDWMDYSNAVYEVKSAREYQDVDTENNAWDTFDERTKGSFAVIREVAKRVETLLGEESSSKIVHDRQRKQSGVTSKEDIELIMTSARQP